MKEGNNEEYKFSTGIIKFDFFNFPIKFVEILQ